MVARSSGLGRTSCEATRRCHFRWQIGSHQSSQTEDVDEFMAGQAILVRPWLVKDVFAAVAAYPTEQLEKMWDYKSYVMEQVKASKGGNDYPRHRA